MKVFDIDPYCSNYPPGLSDVAGAPPFEVEGEDAPFYVYIGEISAVHSAELKTFTEGGRG